MSCLDGNCGAKGDPVLLAGRFRDSFRPILGFLGISFALSVVCGSCSQTQAPTVEKSSGPNLVLIVADTLRADRVEMRRNDKPLMPNLAKLASESWNFRRCRVQATWTKPSMASLFTSLYPEVHRVLFGIDGEIDADNLPQTDVLPASFETFAEFAKAHGYRTAGIQTNANITAHFGFDQGFDSYEHLKYPKFHGDSTTDLALERLAGLSSPFFLYVHYMDAHAPYDTPSDYVDSDAKRPELSEQDLELFAKYGDGYRDRIMFEVGITKQRKFGNLSAAGEEYVRAKYDSSAHFLDAEIARLIAKILERSPDTIIVVTSDHGEELWEHGSIGHAKTVYEELTRIPLIVRVPGAAPRAIDAPVELIDVLPTCAALLGLSKRPEWQGRDIGAEQDRLSRDRPVFGSAMMSITGSNRDLETVIIGTHKLIVDKVAQSKTIYDLELDPGEQRGANYSEVSGAELLARALDTHHASNLAHPLFQDAPTTNALTPEQQENIRNIGYLK